MEQSLVVLDSWFYGILDWYQFGFGRMHSTETAPSDHPGFIRFVFNFFKFSCQRQHELGVSGAVLSWFSSYRSNRTVSMFAKQHFIWTHSSVTWCSTGRSPWPNHVPPVSSMVLKMCHILFIPMTSNCSFTDSNFHKLAELSNCFSFIKSWFGMNQLQLNVKETETLMIAAEHTVFQLKQHQCSPGPGHFYPKLPPVWLGDEYLNTAGEVLHISGISSR